MRVVGLLLKIVDGERPWHSHPKVIVTEYRTHERTQPQPHPRCEG